MIYSSFFSMCVTHFAIGVAVFVLLILIGFWRQHEPWFQFGGPAMSLGLPSRWIAWALASLAFEILSSCKSPLFYQEIALSLVEAPFMALGAFVTDRIYRWQEFDTQINERFSTLRRRPATRTDIPPPPPPPDTTRFDALTKDK